MSNSSLSLISEIPRIPASFLFMTALIIICRISNQNHHILRIADLLHPDDWWILEEHQNP